MNREERAHRERLRDIHLANLRELEVQAARFGELHVPPHIVNQIADLQAKVAELEEQLAMVMPHHNLPPRDYEAFIGRQQERAEMRRLLSPRSRAFVITIDGIGGIGKSALALEAAYSLCDAYPQLAEAERYEAIVWVSAKRSYLTADGILERRQVFRTLHDLFTAIAQVLDFPAITRARPEEQQVIVEQVLSEQRTLLILDNLETVDDEDLLVFLRELPAPTKAIVTTRHRIDVAHPVRLAGLPHQDALALIAQEAARKEITLEPNEREELWQRTGGVPLAIVWSIGLMGLGGSVESVLRRLGSGQSDIAQFCFTESMTQIRGRDAYWLLLALSLFAVDAGREALGIVAGLGEDSFGRDIGLEELLRLSLINKEGDRFSLLPLTRSFVNHEIIYKGEWITNAQRRWLDYFCEFSETYGGWIPDWQGHNRIEQDLPNVLAALNTLIEELHLTDTDREVDLRTDELTTLGKRILSITPKVARVCRLRGYWSECDRLSTIGAQVSRFMKNPIELGWRYYDLGRVSYFRGDMNTAARWANEARDAWKDHSPQRVSYAERILGLVALAEDRIADAEQILTRAMQNYGSEMSYLASNFFEAMGILEEKKGDFATAIKWYQQAINVSRQFDNLPGQSMNLLLLGRVYATTAQYVEAQEYCNEALKLARECSRADVIALSHYQLALLRSRQNQQLPDSDVRQAIDLFRRLGMRKEQAEAEALLRRMKDEAEV